MNHLSTMRFLQTKFGIAGVSDNYTPDFVNSIVVPS